MLVLIGGALNWISFWSDRNQTEVEGNLMLCPEPESKGLTRNQRANAAITSALCTICAYSPFKFASDIACTSSALRMVPA